MFWVLLLLLAWGVAGTACTRLCLAAARAAAVAERPALRHDLSLYEAAFLSGGPARVADLTMVSMARERRLILAHTGWATVVEPLGDDEMERSVIVAIGPEGQSRIPLVRAATAAADAVRQLAEGLVDAGLAVPESARTTVADAVRRVRSAAAVVLLLGAVALLLPGQSTAGTQGPVAAWFSLPLVLTVCCLAIARMEVHPYSHWASPAGRRLLAVLARHTGTPGDRTGAASGELASLTSVAIHGVRAIGEPDLRAALAHR
jgi:uncharacterized protein (TIGR04222 family)